MKRILLIIFAVLLANLQVYAQSKAAESNKNRIILVNPGVFYLEGLQYLTDNNLIDVAGLEYHAVFYSKGEISYQKAKEFVESNKIDYIKLIEVEGELNKDNLYTENSCSKSFAELFSNSEGIIFLGGYDIPAELYTDKTSLLAGIKTPNRHYFELSFLYHLIGRNGNTDNSLLIQNPDYVVMGICLGMQTMNVANGGDMYQDIPSDIYGLEYIEDVLAMDINDQHRNYWTNIDTDSTLNNHGIHQIKLTEGKFLSKLKLEEGKLPIVVSSHHQAVKNIGSAYEIAATSMDGKIVEALQHKQFKNVFGVQFHPEFLGIHDPASRKLKMSPEITELVTEHELLKKANGYRFQLLIWEYFSSLFKS